MAKKAESSLKNMLLSLTIIALVASLALALVNNVTKGPIEKVNQEKIANAVAKVLPAYDSYSVDTVSVETPKGEAQMVRYTAVNAAGELVGKAVESFDDNGFGGRLSAMVGFDAEGNISGYEVLASAETPGLGAKADQWFQKGGKGDVIGKNPSTDNLTVKKDGGQVDAITGSTITSRAFCRLVATAYNAFQIEKGEQQ
ncbi:MAG: RnfABCDGE type electron transport complex subunit G [Bacteroidales bacterium]|nr:RnfABCDGE type electron transport complex subunit G [Bacteroidales bacterium]MBR6330466.1 RnfABCDGE type electron transport complex subunit G [Bacteroidales bacterium]